MLVKVNSIRARYYTMSVVTINLSTLIQLVEGTAEIFGTELAVERTYTFTGANFAIFTWNGCMLEVYCDDKGFINTYLLDQQGVAKGSTRSSHVRCLGDANDHIHEHPCSIRKP